MKFFKDLKKVIFRNFIGALVFCMTCFLVIYFVKARNGLQASPGDKLTSAKRNELVSTISGMQTQINTINSTSTVLATKTVDSTSTLSLSDHQDYTLMPGMTSSVTVGNSGKILGFVRCHYYPGQPVFRVNINNGASYENIYADVAGAGTSMSTPSFLLTGFSPSSTVTLKFEISNGAGTAFTVNFCRLSTLAW